MVIAVTHFQKKLLAWFDQHGRKTLPWQKNKTPYRVWISEIMLQQTQVNAVIPYFERFIKQFPDVETLAKAEEDLVLHYFAGLGYYNRARHLHRSAKLIIEKHNGQMPSSLAALKELPGIGQSTAGAILSIAFSQRAPILDGNVKRVLARLYGIMDAINQKEIENQLWQLAESLTPNKRIAEYSQAMMDLGATLCTPKNPACERCPFMNHCIAYQKGLTDSLPLKKRGKALPIKTKTFIVLKKGKNILLQKRSGNGVWKGLFSLPEMEGQPKLGIIQAFCQKQFNMTVSAFKKLPAFRHTFSHYHLNIYPIVIVDTKKADIAEKTQIWYNLDKPARVGIPKPVQTILRGLS